MSTIKRMISSTVLAASVLAVVPLATASAATVSFKSNAYSGYCMDVYHGIATSGNVVRLFPCESWNTSEQFAVNKDTNGHVHIYYRPSLCVGSSHYYAVLLSCSDSRTNVTEKPVSGKAGEVTFSNLAGTLTASNPTSTDKYPQLSYKSASTSSTQQWNFVVR